ncbi:FixH family protein [Actinokineospora iranica]|uniref:YtkA-like n=1 Tax=Actinokineospora iranica TaxID=1271860 RepID=A0A1G6RYX6_9PSEU|nr:FixH family protein [Actinokineospora iranica]SDD09157.1 YtkA-like [Actinokineospora iranica]
MTPRGKAVLAVTVAVVIAALVWVWRLGGDDATLDLRAGTPSYAVRLTVADPRVGANSVLVELTDTDGRPVAADEVTVEPVMVDMGHALTPVTAVAEGGGRYRADRTDLPMAGPWEITVAVRRASTTEHAVFSLIV